MFGRNLVTLVQQLWQDDRGAVTLEYLLLGSLVAAGGVAGLSAMSDAVNDEMREFGNSVRQIRQAAPIQMPTRFAPASRAGQRRFESPTANSVECVSGQCELECP